MDGKGLFTAMEPKLQAGQRRSSGLFLGGESANIKDIDRADVEAIRLSLAPSQVDPRLKDTSGGLAREAFGCHGIQITASV